MYLLRRVIFENKWEKQLEELIAFCREVPIEEVLLMEQSHQIQMSAFPLEKHRRMARIFSSMGDALRNAGIGYGVNIASLVGHLDAEMPPEKVLPFQKYVTTDLKPFHSLYCILDPGWQKYASEVCGLYAASHPGKLFVDDDFRSLGHSTDHPFGCFCEIHVRQTAERCGLPLDARKLVEHVRGGSETDQRVRRAWMEINFEGQMQAASQMQAVVAATSPSTRLGLMSSSAEDHAVQGRRMSELLRTFAGPSHRPLSRPGFAFYRDTDLLHEGSFVQVQGAHLSMSTMGEGVEHVSEVEGWPHSRFLKGATTLKRELLMHALSGCEGFTLNIFDYIATPLAAEPVFGKALQEIKPHLQQVVALRQGKTLCGFGRPWRETMAARLNPRGHLENLRPDRSFDILLSRLGIPTQMTIAAANALLGDETEAFTDAEIDSMLTGGLMLDAEAARNLQNRGFAEQIGCRVGKSLPHAAVEYLQEHKFCGPHAHTLLNTAWFRLTSGKSIFSLEADPSAEVLSTLLDLDDKPVGPGTLLFENSRGGRIAVFAAPISAYTWHYRNRAYVVGHIVEWLMKDRLPVWIEDAPDVAPFYYEDPGTGEGVLAIVSGNLDSMPVTVHSRLKIIESILDPKATIDAPMTSLELRIFRTRR